MACSLAPDRSYRPQLLWLVAGPLLGAACGAVVATVLIWGTALLASASVGPGGLLAGLLAGLLVGCIFGGVPGLAVGLVVGVPMAVLVGRHLPREVAMRRAYALGAVLPPLALAGLAAITGVDTAWIVLPLAGAALTGSLVAGWMAGQDDYAWRAS